MTQAMALKHVLASAGHTVEAVCVGASARRQLPAFFVESMGARVAQFESPNFVSDLKNRGVLVGASLWKNLLRTDKYLKSLSQIDQVVEDVRPDLVINFYEPLWGLYQKRHGSKVDSVSVAHQFLVDHQDFSFPQGRSTEKTLLTTLNAVTGSGSKRRLCLSFTPMAEPDDARNRVVPPLLRPALFELTPTEGDYLLAYVMQAGYGDDIISWHERNPDIKIHCFWDRDGAPEVEQKSDNLTFHRLSETKFLRMMAGCRGLVTTAGFESVCEAMYLGKPVLMVPVEGHYEQACNAIDAERAGAGVWRYTFDLDALVTQLQGHRVDPAIFRKWADSGPERIVAEIEQTVQPG
jgi:uncharacterized protein (TIGR00661 family)